MSVAVKSKIEEYIEKRKEAADLRVSHSKTVDFVYDVAQWMMKDDTMAKLNRELKDLEQARDKAEAELEILRRQLTPEDIRTIKMNKNKTRAY